MWPLLSSLEVTPHPTLAPPLWTCMPAADCVCCWAPSLTLEPVSLRVTVSVLRCIASRSTALLSSAHFTPAHLHLQIISMESYGTDAYLHLNRLVSCVLCFCMSQIRFCPKQTCLACCRANIRSHCHEVQSHILSILILDLWPAFLMRIIPASLPWAPHVQHLK